MESEKQNDQFNNKEVRFCEIYNQEVTNERKQELEDKLKEILLPVEKINFLKAEKKRYLQNISAETIDVSGVMSYKRYDKDVALFFDRYIQIEIDYYIDQIKDELNYPDIVNKNKLKWAGTPGEFGAIFNLLFDKGYIEVIKDKSNIVKRLNEIFEVKNEDGKIVNPKYFYKCFGDKEKKYNPGQLKIPNSDNYNKDK